MSESDLATSASAALNGLMLPQLVRARAGEKAGGGPFLGDVSGRWLSYADVHQRSLRWAGCLAGLGLGPGDRVAVMISTSSESIELWLAAAWLGALEVPIHVEQRGAFLRHILNDSGATVLVIAESFLDRLRPLAAELEHLETVVVLGGNSTPEPIGSGWRGRVLSAAELEWQEFEAAAGPKPWDVGSIIYTSGTTGAAKGVMVPWRMFYSHGELFFPTEDTTAADRFYCPLPLGHIAGRVAIYRMALSGGSSVLRERFSIENFWADVAATGCTCALMIGSVAKMLWRRPESAEDAATPLRMVLMAPLIPQVEEFKKRFGLRVRTQFGMTETMAPVASGVTGPWDLANPDSCGRVLPGFECRIADEQDEPLGPGEVGELLIRTESPWLTMVGYWNDPASTARAFRNQWFHTGDGFRCDADGNYYFVDRIKDTIRRRGENISSFMVEQTIAEHGAVADCAVVGVASEFTEQEILAFVVRTPGAEAIAWADIVAFLSSRLPSLKSQMIGLIARFAPIQSSA